MAYDKEKKAEWYRKHHRNSVLKNRYGITEAEYNKMFEVQEGKCLICGVSYDGSTRNMDVDHCHNSGKVRGLLCSPCNRGIGYLQDDPELLEVAAEYLRRHTGEIGGKGGSCGV